MLYAPDENVAWGGQSDPGCRVQCLEFSYYKKLNFSRFLFFTNFSSPVFTQLNVFSIKQIIKGTPHILSELP